MKNTITCWNYLYLSKNLEDAESPEKHQALLLAIANGSISVWRHINMIGEYDFSDEKLQDSIGIKPPKLID
ncbi:MAG: Tn3 family transposase [Spirochaetaceae bacterium]|nr:Tn3 family transposase [Spirochaetaceae bacterium]